MPLAPCPMHASQLPLARMPSGACPPSSSAPGVCVHACAERPCGILDGMAHRIAMVHASAALSCCCRSASNVSEPSVHAYQVSALVVPKRGLLRPISGAFWRRTRHGEQTPSPCELDMRAGSRPRQSHHGYIHGNCRHMSTHLIAVTATAAARAGGWTLLVACRPTLAAKCPSWA